MDTQKNQTNTQGQNLQRQNQMRNQNPTQRRTPQKNFKSPQNAPKHKISNMQNKDNLNNKTTIQGIQKTQNLKGQKMQNQRQNVRNEQNTQTTPNSQIIKNPTKSDNSKKVKITFLGGVGEIGKNLTVFETENEMIIVDCGLTFPNNDYPGIDVVVPDVSYLLANQHKLKAIILTHGHEDHIGGLPFLLNDIKAPVYGSRLTLALLDNKMREFPKVKYKTITVKPKNLLKLGDFTVEFIKVSHSIAGALALCISTPAGNIIHTGDFKIDFTPIDDSMTDLTRFGELGKKGVQLLLCESTNVGRKGYSMSESNVGKVLEEVAFKQHISKRLIIATFASNIHRLQQILNLAEKYKRKVAFTGRSMINISEVAMKVGELSYNKNNIISIEKISKYADSELLIVSTGSQGEPMSALTRMASDDFKQLKIGNNDTIVLSASPIPGNEKNVYNVINRLFKKGADVIYDELADVHTSGHACQEEIKTIHALTKPKFFIPVHGEYRHLKQHKELALNMGMEERHIILPDIGMQLELTPTNLKQIGFTKAGMRLVDGTTLGDVESNVLSDRKQLSEDGFCVTILTISGTTSELIGEPFIITRGVVYNYEADSIVKELKAGLSVFIKGYDFKEMDFSLLKNEIRKFISNFIYKKTKRRPITLAMVMRI
ncbi:MAG: ribonuclease J [Clostridia bacterium]|nr:ribonuclease J [Clostridia bacterium]MDD3862556.1 ribonuclease J [Clostridia bacterium]MDD4408440.1 ribonuclease J [Clostridia bacterium]